MLRAINRFKFFFRKQLQNGKQHFKRTNNSCKCYLIFNLDGSTVVDKTQGNNHNYNTQTALVHQKVSNMLKHKAVDCLSDKPSKIIRQALVEDGTIDVS